MWIWIVLAIIAILLIGIISIYNLLVTSRQKVKNAWSQIDVQLQRRFDLIPNLVETVKAYASHEEDIFTKVSELRSKWSDASSISDKVNIDNELNGALKSIMAIAENYPDLKANTNFLQLQSELSETENKISFSRQFYNDTTTMYNTKLETFPSNIIASLFHFTPETLFEVSSKEARNNVKVDFNK